MIRDAIARVVAGESLTHDEAAQVMEEIMAGEATPAQFGAFVTALRLKGETVDEIAGFARVMRAKSTQVTVDDHVVDIVGTGGDGKGTFNISTTSAFVAAGAGVAIAKHGNRAASSHCGAADVLEALGVNITLTAPQVATCINETGMGFMFAQLFHPAMKHAAGPRGEIGIRTVFNILGPLTNPARAQRQVLGVASPGLVDAMAQALALLGSKHVLVVHGEDGIDEISICAPTRVSEVRGGAIRNYVIAPEDFGFPRATLDDVKGGTAAENAAITRAVLDGETGPRRNVVLLNAAAGIVAADHASDFPSAIERAAAAIDRGLARQKLDQFARASQRIVSGGTA